MVLMNNLPTRYTPPEVTLNNLQDSFALITVRRVAELYWQHNGTIGDPVRRANQFRAISDFCEEYGEARVHDLKRFHLVQWIGRHPSWKSGWTKRRSASEIRSVFTWALALDLIERNPFSDMRMPKGGRGRAVTLEEYSTMLRHSSPLFRRILIFLRYTGCRPGEMTAAKWSDLDLKRSCIQLRQHKTADRTGLPRTIVLHPVCLKLIAWIARHDPHKRFIFVNKSGRQWGRTSLYCRMEQIRQRADIEYDLTLYGLRHGYAVQAVLNGVDIATLAPLMGHNRIETTAYYANVAGRTDHLQDAVKTIFQPAPRAKKKGGQS
jgi:site-specific recombinase XerD